MRRKVSDIGISDILGTILMLSMAIALFAVVSLFVLSYPFSTPSPQVDIVSFIDGTDIIWEHHGGPSLDLDTKLSLTINGTNTRLEVSDYLESDFSNNGKWDIGERVTYPAGDMSGFQVKVLVIDTDSNSVVMMGTLQEGTSDGGGGGAGPTPPSLATSVDSISPYEKSSSPLGLTATGDSDLDNVSLNFRWSNDNWSTSWTTLTYDDFETDFGNYTDGGGDCSLYTGGTFAHQGSNAADIQDNSGVDSSFYHTSGIDVDTAGYNSIKVDFWFYAVSMGPSHDFWIQYFDGTDWNTVADYDQGDEFVNDQFYHEIVWINETDYNFPSDMKIRFMCDANNDNDDVYIDEIYVNASSADSIDWTIWNDALNPDTSSPWSWNFNYPNGAGYYEFYSIGKYDGDSESAPGSADAICYYNP